MNKLTIAILAKNEAKNLEQLLPTLSFADEVIVINDQSTDQTEKVSKKYNAKILNHPLNFDFSAARQYGLTHSRNEWVMFVDADERLSPSLIRWLKEQKFSDNIGGYSFHRRDWFWGHLLKYGETANCHLTRLVNKNQGKFTRSVHEVWETEKTVIKVNSKYLIDHYPHQNIAEFLKHVNLYSTINAQYWHRQKRKVTVWEIMFVPWGKFMFTYFIKLGLLDGAAGFIYSFMMSFHSFLSRAKLYQLSHHD